MTIEQQIREYLIENIVFSESSLEISDEASLLDKGIVDSVAVMELVLFVEESFALDIEDHEIIPENFDSIANLAGFVRRRQKNISI